MWNTLKQAQHYLQETLYTLRETPVLFLSSGGSVFQLLENVPEDVLGKHLTLSVLDERFSQDPTINNFLQLSVTDFYCNVARAGCNLISTVPNDGESIDSLASRFEHGLRSWRAQHPHGSILITQGVGSDGHTAGIMPYPEDKGHFHQLFESKRWVVGYHAGGKNPHPERVTATITFLKEAVDLSIVYAAGLEKGNALERLYAKNENAASLPASVIWQMKKVKMFTDFQLV